MVGAEYSFQFSNQESNWSDLKKKQSPSQRKRNAERQDIYDLKNIQKDKIVETKNEQKTAMKDSTAQTEVAKTVEVDNKEVQTTCEEKKEYKNAEAQTIDTKKEALNDQHGINHGHAEKDKVFHFTKNNPCESCTKVFRFKKVVCNSMCDKCIIVIAAKENIALPNKYECEICKKRFKTKTQIKEHNNCYFKSLTFVCEVCRKLWRKKDEFEHHMAHKHNNHDCVRCAGQFEGKDNLDAHYKLKHRAF